MTSPYIRKRTESVGVSPYCFARKTIDEQHLARRLTRDGRRFSRKHVHVDRIDIVTSVVVLDGTPSYMRLDLILKRPKNKVRRPFHMG